MISKNLLLWFVLVYAAFTGINYYINISAPNSDYKEQLTAFVNQYEKGIPKTSTQDSAVYAGVLAKLKSADCKGVGDNANNVFYTCTDGSSASVIAWTRQERKGVVTRYFDKNKNLVMIYGHPDDTY